MKQLSIYLLTTCLLIGIFACGSNADRSELPRVVNDRQTSTVTSQDRGLPITWSNHRLTVNLETTTISVGSAVLAPRCIGFLPSEFVLGYIHCPSNSDQHVLQVKHVEQRCSVPGEEFVVKASERLPLATCENPVVKQYSFNPPLSVRALSY